MADENILKQFANRHADSSLDLASRVPAAQKAQVVDLSRRSGLPEATVEADPVEAERLTQLRDNQRKVQGSPVLRQFLATRDNAELSYDDIDNLMETEALVEERSFLENAHNDLKRGAQRLFGNVDTFQAVGSQRRLDGFNRVEAWEALPEEGRPSRSEFTSSLRGNLSALTYRNSGPEERRELREKEEAFREEQFHGIAAAQELAAELPHGAGREAFNQTTGFKEAFGAFADAPLDVASSLTLESLMQFAPALLAGPTGVAGMVAAGGVTGLVNEYGGDIQSSMAKAGIDLNDSAQVTAAFEDPEQLKAWSEHALARGVPIAIIDGLSMGLAGRLTALAQGFSKTALVGAGEALVLQPAMGAAGEVAGTLAAGDEIEGRDVLAEALGEILPGAFETAVGVYHARARQAAEEVERRAQRQQANLMQSAAEQDLFDRVVALSQASLTNQRAQDRYKEFLDGAAKGDSVYIPQEVIQALLDAEVELPPLLTDGLTATGEDLAITLGDFGSIVARDEELLTALRPHVRLRAEGLTQTEIAKDDNESLRRIVEQAQQDQAVLTEAEEIYEEVKDQLAATGRQSELTARYSAQLIPAYVVLKAKELGMSSREVYTLTGLSIERGETAPAGDVLAQAEAEGYEGADLGEAYEWTRAVAKGLDMSHDGRMERAREQGYDTANTLYHGTGFLKDPAVGIDAFDLPTARKTAGAGIFLTNEPAIADSYAHGVNSGTIYPLYVAVTGPLRVYAEGANWNNLESNSLVVEFPDGTQEDARVYLGLPEDVRLTSDDLARRVRSKGHDALVLQDIRDIGPSLTEDLPPEQSELTVVFDPAQIRSVHAAFDPDYADSSNLLAQEGPVTATDFKKAIHEARVANGHGAAVDEEATSEYDFDAVFLLDEGKAGFAIKPDGELTAVFKHPDSTLSNALATIVPLAIQNGATKLSAFEGYLTEQYAQQGFEEVGRTPWSDEHKPDTWREEDGTPDVVHMELNDERANSTPAQSTEIRRNARQARGTTSPLEGAPNVEGATGPDARLNLIADQYAAGLGLPHDRQKEFKSVVLERAKRIARAYEEMEHAPEDPQVAQAYAELIEQTLAQYEALVEDGYQFYFYDEQSDPYDGNPWNAMRDLRINKRMAVFTTDSGFGSLPTGAELLNNPLLADTGLTWDFNGEQAPVLANDVFRAVHDAFGHGLEGAGFRAQGEENAWFAHMQLFTGLARGALTTETRGQNSWLNYGPYGEQNRLAQVEDTVFADQKTGLMPEWTWAEGSENIRVLNQSELRERLDGDGNYKTSGDVQPATEVRYQTSVVGRETLKEVDTGFERLDTAEKVARATATLSKLAQEKLWVVATDEVGKPLEILNHSMGLKASSQADPGIIAGWAVNVEGAANVWVSHNHPSGNSDLSEADVGLSSAIGNLLEGTQVNYRGVLAVTPHFFTHETSEVDSLIPVATEENKVRLTERTLEVLPSHTSKVISDPASARAVVAALSEGDEGIVLLDIQNAPVGFLPFDFEKDGAMLRSRRLSDLLSVVDQTNATAAILTVKVLSGTEDNVANMLNAARIKTLDVFVDGKSEAEKGASFGNSREFQQGDRGSIQLLDDARVIKLAGASDLSTFLHESGHLFLEMEKAFAAKFGTTPLQEDLLSYLGAESFDEVTASTPSGVVKHEKFARAFEAYLREGKAPSLKLREAFSAFARWLKQIYRRLAQLDVELDDNIRNVFDRLLASEVEIAEARGSEAYDQFFTSAQAAGMTAEEWTKYQARVAKSRNTAATTLDEKLIKELRERRTRWWNQEKQPIVDEERERLSALPAYQILTNLPTEPMDYDEVVALNGGKLPGRLVGKAKKGGVDPVDYAEAHGYPSAAAMLKDITTVPTLKVAADEAAQARMIQEHGDMLNDGTIEQEAQEAAHNDAQAELLFSELQTLKRQGNLPQTLNRTYLKAEARRLIRSMKYRELKPGRFYQAEIRAARNAVKAQTPQDQFTYKLQQLANHYLYREAVDAREAMQMQRRYVRAAQTRKFDPKQIAPDFIQNIKILANLYEMRNKPKQELGIRSILEWYTAQLDDPNQFVKVELLDPNLVLALEARRRGELPKFNLTKFDDLAGEDLRGLYDMLRHLRHVGGRMSDSEKARFAEERVRLQDNILAEGGKDHPQSQLQPRRWEDGRRRIQHMVNKLPSLRNLIRVLDGFDDGPAAELIYREVEGANSQKIRMSRQLYDTFKAELNDIHKIGLDRSGRTTVTQTKADGTEWSLHSEGRFMLALYWGTESSREAIREGHGVTDADVAAMLETLTAEQLRLVNATWKVNESMWPDLSASATKVYGVAPPKLEATPFTTRGVEMHGGHMRLFYDSQELELRSERDQAGMMSTIMPTKAGSLHSRVGSGGRPVRLDRNNISQSLNETVHFIAFAEAGLKVAGLLNADQVKGAIERKHGKGYYKALIETVDAITSARREREAIPGLAHGLRILRKAASFKVLAYSLRNVLQQVTALPVAADEVGYKNLLNQYVRFATPTGYTEMREFANERSEFMRDRASFVNREASEYLNQVEITGRVHHAWDTYGRFGFVMQTFVDAQIAYPAWMASYEAAIEKHGDEVRAISDADTSVAESVGSGADLHMGGAYQSSASELTRTLTLFGSWFNNYYQRMYRTSEGFSSFDAETFRTLVTTPLVVAVMSSLIIMDGPEGDDEWYEWAMKSYGSFMAGTIPLLRDIVGSFSGFSPKTLLSGALETPFRLTSEVEAYAEGRQTGVKASSDVLKIVSTVVPIGGASNVTRTLDYLDSYEQGKEGQFNPYQMLVEGPDRNK